MDIRKRQNSYKIIYEVNKENGFDRWSFNNYCRLVDWLKNEPIENEEEKLYRQRIIDHLKKENMEKLNEALETIKYLNQKNSEDSWIEFLNS